ncbi:MAG: hypothetical protein AAFW70_12005 [Cyanobacteria bacterium J06635_10]
MKYPNRFQKGNTIGYRQSATDRPITRKTYGGKLYDDQMDFVFAIAEREDKPISQVIRDAIDFYQQHQSLA